MKNHLSLFIQETLINHVFVQTTVLDIHRNTHSLYTSKGSQSKEGSQVKTRPQTKMKLYESTRALSVPVESPNPKVWYTAQTHCLCLWGTEGDDGDAQRLEMSKCNDRKKKIYASSTEDPQVDIFRLVSCLTGPEATSWLHSDSLLFLPLSHRLLEKEFLLLLMKWQDTVEIAQA